jgi:acetoin utilization deacetylase AcuC-like enzyme
MTIPVYYSTEYIAAAYEFPVTRKAGWIVESLRREPIAGIEIIEPTPLTEEELGAVHDPAYVSAVRTGEPRRLAESNGFDWDEKLWSTVCASNGGAVQAALAAYRGKSVAGSLSSGLHHAKAGHGDGYCTFNVLALATRRVLDAGAQSVLIIDLDAHCGGGTFELLREESRVRSVDLAVSSYDWYRDTAPMTLDVVSNAKLYLPTLERRLAELTEMSFDLVLYNAGMDPFEACDTGGLRGITFGTLEDREKLVFDWCSARRLPVAFVLAGGYVNRGLTENELVDLHRLTLTAAARTVITVDAG